LRIVDGFDVDVGDFFDDRLELVILIAAEGEVFLLEFLGLGVGVGV